MKDHDYDVVRNSIREIPDYPKKGIVFRDITTLLKDKRAFGLCIDALTEWVKERNPDYIVGIEARGFILGAAIASRLDVGFVPVRKKGKLPHKTIGKTYKLEYGEDSIEVHEDAIEKGSKVVIVDDLLATGGTAKAAADLVESTGGKVAGLAFAIELEKLDGARKLVGYDVFSLVKY